MRWLVSQCRRRFRLLAGLLFGAIGDGICVISLIQTVQLWRLVQKGKITVCPDPRLAGAEVVVCLCQARTLGVGDAEKPSAFRCFVTRVSIMLPGICAVLEPDVIASYTFDSGLVAS